MESEFYLSQRKHTNYSVTNTGKHLIFDPIYSHSFLILAHKYLFAWELC